MVQFDKLRLSGFKSFVDPTELVIESGMTGIVGPNGCGKSNLVEALKWVMGETSAKQMRGSEMEDVIFAGAGTRPARNIAEVMLSLDNKTRTAPAMVNDADQLEISRDIRTHVLPHVPRVRESALASPALGSAMSTGVSALASPRALTALALRGAGACTS